MGGGGLQSNMSAGCIAVSNGAGGAKGQDSNRNKGTRACPPARPPARAGAPHHVCSRSRVSSSPTSCVTSWAAERVHTFHLSVLSLKVSRFATRRKEERADSPPKSTYLPAAC